MAVRNIIKLILLSGVISLGVITPTNAVCSTNRKLEVEWEVFFGDSGEDFALDLIQTVDGGFACLAGKEDGPASLVKFNASGKQEWKSTFWDVNPYQNDYLVQTSDKGYVILDSVSSYGGDNTSIFLTKMTSTGHPDWNVSIGGVGDNYDWAKSIFPTNDGGFALAGATTGDVYDMLLVKTDALCVPEWNCTFGGDEFDLAFSVIQTDEGGYALAGRYGLGGHDMWLVKTDSNGQHEWNQTFGGLKDDVAQSVIQLTDGSFILAGDTESFASSGTDFWLLKTDMNGQHLWNTTYSNQVNDVFKSLIQTADGGFLLVGNSATDSSDSDIWLVKTDVNGQQEWNASLDGIREDTVSSVLQVSDDGFVIAGSTQPAGIENRDMWLLKVKVSEDSRTSGFELGVFILTLSLLVLILRKRSQ